MSNFNEYFKNQGAKTIVDRFFNNADCYNNNYKIKNLTHSIVEEPPFPASHYIENGLTATHKVRLEYNINDDPDVKVSEFEIPKEIDGAFIIDGAYRISTNSLASDYDCRIKMSGTGDHIINFDFFRRYDIARKVLKIKKQDPSLSVVEQDVNIKYDDIDTVTGETKELLKLTEIQSKKFQIKLDLDYKPEYITTKLIQECLAFGDDRDKDLIIDKTIESVSTSFMKYIFRSNNCRNYISARRQITTYFTRNGRLQDQINAISTLAKRFFKGSADSAGDSGLQVPPGVNSMNLDSIGSKISVPDTVAFNPTFADLIDLAD